MQAHPPRLQGAPVFESALGGATESARSAALRPLSPDEARGIRADRVLELRTANGATLRTDMIALSRLPAQLKTRGELFDICESRGIPVSDWTILAHVAMVDHV